MTMDFEFKPTIKISNYDEAIALQELNSGSSGELLMDERVETIKEIAHTRLSANETLGSAEYGAPKTPGEALQRRTIDLFGQNLDSMLKIAATGAEPYIELSGYQGISLLLLSDVKPNRVGPLGLIKSYEGLTRDNMISPNAKYLWDALETRCLVFDLIPTKTWGGCFLIRIKTP